MNTATEGPSTPISYSEAARRMGVRRETLAWLAERNGITPKPVPTNAKAKGLDAADLAILSKAWKRVKVTP